MENLYFLAIIPPEPVYEEVVAFKKDFATRFASTKALKVMPHITLKAPFKLNSSDHAQVIQWFKKLKTDIPPFRVELVGFGSFPKTNKPVVFILPAPNTSLDFLQKEIINDFKIIFSKSVSPVDTGFTPHITIAYRDLSPGNYAVAWKEYKTKEYRRTFDVNCFYLLPHDTQKWNVIDTCPL